MNDVRFSNKHEQLLAKTVYPLVYKQLVDIARVNVDVLGGWIAEKCQEVLGIEDEVLQEYVVSLLQEVPLDPRHLQISLTPFLASNTVRFMKDLWAMLLDAQASPQGIASSIVERKKLEIQLEREQRDKRVCLQREEKERRMDQVRGEPVERQRFFDAERRDESGEDKECGDRDANDVRERRDQSSRRRRSPTPPARRGDRHRSRSPRDASRRRYYSRERRQVRGRERSLSPKRSDRRSLLRERRGGRDKRDRRSLSCERRDGRNRSRSRERRRRRYSTSDSSSSESEVERREKDMRDVAELTKDMTEKVHGQVKSSRSPSRERREELVKLLRDGKDNTHSSLHQ